ncbi:TPA: hypothetical protein N0F65_008043 [Lagenidium giganteum]|uniref:RING-type E3 ubiquitin transferase n=1 Tax=Lagenidium giganteum TaxID=4803 RepID=A0AAV2YIK7_9STRA|nr:TPA: hypothetical protein N0F65_008043 [Lagenidium giganteum]
MSAWVSSWLNGGNANGDGDAKGDGATANVDEAPAVVPTAEEIRQKRLERLRMLEQQAPAEAKPAASTPAVPAPAPAPKATPAAAPVVTKPVAPAPAPAAAPAPTEAAAPRKKPSTSVARIFLNDSLQRVLQLTLSDTARSVSSSDRALLFMRDVASSLGTTVLTDANVAEVLYARLVMDPVQLSGTAHPLAVVAYLEQCYYRCRDELQKLSSSFLRLSAEEKTQAEQCLASLRDTCVNYAVTALTEPEMFPFETGTINHDALDKLVRAQAHALTPDFIDAVANGLEQSGQTFAVFAPIFQKLLSELFLINPPSVFDNFHGNIHVIAVLVRKKGLAHVFTNIPGFLLLPGAPFTGRRLQDATALGLLLRFSASEGPMVQQMFSNITKRTKNDVDNSIRSIRMKLTSLQSLCTEVVKLLLKAGGSSREQVLKWLEQAVKVNAERAKENPDATVTSTYGMILNLTMVLLSLCGPFLPPQSNKAHLIDTKFLVAKNPVFPHDVTKLIGQAEGAATQDDRAAVDLTSFNFVTRCFFLTARTVHLGPVAVITQYMRLLRQLSFYQSRMNDNTDPRMRAHFEALASAKMVLDAEILHPDLLDELIRFALLSCTVVTNICSGGEMSALPLPDVSVEQNPLLRHVPEHLVEDVCSVLIFIARLQPQALNAFPLDELLKMIILFLSSPSYVRSPHLRAKMSELLFFIFLPPEETEERQTAGTPSGMQLLTMNPTAQELLAPCLLALYGDVEQTGFYEKLEHRYNIACLLKFLWKLPTHKPAFVRISEDKEKFVKFAHGLMNHINSLVTDALTSLPEVKSLQEEMQDVARWMTLDETVREQKQSLLAEKERTVTSSLQLANETVHMMSYLTSEIQEPFVMPELEERMVSMLNSVLVKLAGPRGVDLKVSNPEQYRFRPKEMLKEIVETILHFANCESFQKAMATNGFYDGPIFVKCVQILRRTQLLPGDDIERFEVFVNLVNDVAKSLAHVEESLGEIPDEFLDPLVFTLMKDPVTLPTSGYSLDRSTISQHLLNDQSDPFTRAPLSVDQLVPNTELKAKIEAWVQAQVGTQQ